MEKGEPLFFGLRPVWSEAKEEWREPFLLLFHQGKESLDATRGPFFSLPMAAKNRTNGGRKKKNMKKDEGKELKGLRRQQGRRILLSFIQTIADQVQVGHPPCSFIPLIPFILYSPSSVIKGARSPSLFLYFGPNLHKYTKESEGPLLHSLFSPLSPSAILFFFFLPCHLFLGRGGGKGIREEVFANAEQRTLK